MFSIAIKSTAGKITTLEDNIYKKKTTQVEIQFHLRYFRSLHYFLMNVLTDEHFATTEVTLLYSIYTWKVDTDSYAE